MTQKKLAHITNPESSDKSSSVTLSAKDDSVVPLLSHDKCKHTTKTENGMIIHNKKKHDIGHIDGDRSICYEKSLASPFTCTFLW